MSRRRGGAGGTGARGWLGVANPKCRASPFGSQPGHQFPYWPRVCVSFISADTLQDPINSNLSTVGFQALHAFNAHVLLCAPPTRSAPPARTRPAGQRLRRDGRRASERAPPKLNLQDGERVPPGDRPERGCPEWNQWFNLCRVDWKRLEDPIRPGVSCESLAPSITPPIPPTSQPPSQPTKNHSTLARLG